MGEVKYTLKEAVDILAGDFLHVCDVEAQEVANWIAKNGTPDAVIVLESVEKIMRAAQGYADSYDAYIIDSVKEALESSKQSVFHDDLMASIREAITMGEPLK